MVDIRIGEWTEWWEGTFKLIHLQTSAVGRAARSGYSGPHPTKMLILKNWRNWWNTDVLDNKIFRKRSDQRFPNYNFKYLEINVKTNSDRADFMEEILYRNYFYFMSEKCWIPCVLTLASLLILYLLISLKVKEALSAKICDKVRAKLFLKLLHKRQLSLFPYQNREMYWTALNCSLFISDHHP